MMRIGGHFHSDHPLDDAVASGAKVAQFFLGDPQGCARQPPADVAEGVLEPGRVDLPTHCGQRRVRREGERRRTGERVDVLPDTFA